MGEKPADPESREEYVKQRKQMVGWLKTELGIDVNSGGLADRIIKWGKASSLLSKMAEGPAKRRIDHDL